jgi:hypothetical protein
MWVRPLRGRPHSLQVSEATVKLSGISWLQMVKLTSVVWGIGTGLSHATACKVAFRHNFLLCVYIHVTRGHLSSGVSLGLKWPKHDTDCWQPFFLPRCEAIRLHAMVQN